MSRKKPLNPLLERIVEHDKNLSVPPRAEMIREKSGGGVAGGKAVNLFPKSDFRHWEQKVFRNSYSEAGERRTAKTFSVRIGFRGQRHNLPLGLANQREAAKRARDAYISLISNGWEETLKVFKPTVETEAEAVVTVGVYIASASQVTTTRAISFHGYCRSLRRIVAGVKQIKGTRKKFAPKRGAAEWQATLDATPLSEITADAVKAWKLAYVKEAGTDPAAIRRAKNTFNSTLRQAKGLFSRKVLADIPASLVPSPLPLAGVDPWEKGSTRYLSKMDAEAIITSAAVELGSVPTKAEPWKILLLGLCCGLRKKEIDTLTWRQVDLRAGVIHIVETEFLQPKAQDSIGEIDLDPQVVAILQGFKARASGDFVIESKTDFRAASAIMHYRCDHHFETLNRWLRGKGITARKPLHELRKEAGSLVAREKGLFAAQSFLRHASPQTTAAYYLAKKERLSTGLGRLLTEASTKVVSLPAPAAIERKTTNKSAG